MVSMAELRRNVEFAFVSEEGAVYSIPCTSSTLNIYDSVDKYNAGRMRITIATNVLQASKLMTNYYIFPCILVIKGELRTISSSTDFSWALFRTGVATGFEEVRAAKHAALRGNKIRVK